MSKEPVGYGEPGDLNALKCRLWAAVEAAASLLKSRKPELKLKAVHATSQASAAYVRLVETADLEARLAALEDRIARGTDES